MKKADPSKAHAVQDFLTKVNSTNIGTLLNTFSYEKDAFLAISNVLSKFCPEIKLSSREYNSQDLKHHNMSGNVTIASGIRYLEMPP